LIKDKKVEGSRGVVDVKKPLQGSVIQLVVNLVALKILLICKRIKNKKPPFQLKIDNGGFLFFVSFELAHIIFIIKAHYISER
jgi:hypothetical protein